MSDKKSRWEKFEKNASDFMIVYAGVLGIFMGLGFLFLGLIRNKLDVVLFAGLALVMGLAVIPSLINEKDEYDLIEKLNWDEGVELKGEVKEKKLIIKKEK
jgi:hypothetical protein